MSKSDKQYLELDLGRSLGLDFVKIQVKIEEEGVVLDIFNEEDECIDTNSKLWEDIVSDEWGLTLLELLNKQHNPEFVEEE
tara:strand:+ start:393 stop:635 length:243 start_codon:yes stop_codon:yes gene_type:complete